MITKNFMVLVEKSSLAKPVLSMKVSSLTISLMGSEDVFQVMELWLSDSLRMTSYTGMESV